MYAQEILDHDPQEERDLFIGEQRTFPPNIKNLVRNGPFGGRVCILGDSYVPIKLINKGEFRSPKGKKGQVELHHIVYVDMNRCGPLLLEDVNLPLVLELFQRAVTLPLPGFENILIHSPNNGIPLSTVMHDKIHLEGTDFPDNYFQNLKAFQGLLATNIVMSYYFYYCLANNIKNDLFNDSFRTPRIMLLKHAAYDLREQYFRMNSRNPYQNEPNRLPENWEIISALVENATKGALAVQNLRPDLFQKIHGVICKAGFVHCPEQIEEGLSELCIPAGIYRDF